MKTVTHRGRLCARLQARGKRIPEYSSDEQRRGVGGIGAACRRIYESQHLAHRIHAHHTVGLVAKTGLDAAAGVLAELAGWLEAREVRAVFETDTAALAGLRRTGGPSLVTSFRPCAI